MIEILLFLCFAWQFIGPQSMWRNRAKMSGANFNVIQLASAVCLIAQWIMFLTYMSEAKFNIWAEASEKTFTFGQYCFAAIGSMIFAIGSYFLESEEEEEV